MANIQNIVNLLWLYSLEAVPHLTIVLVLLSSLLLLNRNKHRFDMCWIYSWEVCCLWLLCCVVLDRYWPNFVVIFWHQKLQFVTFCCYIDLQEWSYVLSASLFLEWQCVPVFFPDKAVVSMDIRIWHKVASHTACEPSWLHVYSQFMQVILHRQRSCPSRAVIAQLGLFCVNLQFTNG